MAKAPKVQYNADKKAEERAEGVITIGGREFHPVKRSGKLMKQLIELGPDEESANVDENRVITKAETQEQIGQLYAQLTVLLKDKESGENPDQEFLEEELDFEDAQELVTQLSPSKADADAEGNGASA